MIDTTIPDVDVAELMQRVRAEAAKIAARDTTRRGAPELAATLPRVRKISPPPALRPIKRVNFKRAKFDELLRRARESTEVARWIPKPFRGLFRNQDEFNRRLLETVASLVKVNNELANRIDELAAAAESQSRWLANARAAAAGHEELLARAHEHLSLLQAQADRLGVHVVNVQNEANALRDRVRSWVNRLRSLERETERPPPS